MYCLHNQLILGIIYLIALHAQNNLATPANDRESSAANCPCSDNEDNMIACENPKCDVEWYHISCVGLDELGNTDFENLEWYCPACEGMCESCNDSTVVPLLGCHIHCIVFVAFLFGILYSTSL